jgi:GNAT superfamily N-acetyltransferase
MIDRERALAIQRRALRDCVAFVADAAQDSRLVERDGVSAAVVPATPDRSVPNSVTYRDAHRLAEALPELADVYEAAGVRRWTVWAPEFDREASRALEDAGHALDASPAAMVVELDALRAPALGDLEYDSECDMPTLARANDAAYESDPESGLTPALVRRPADLDLRLYRARVEGEVASVLSTIDHPPASPGAGPDCGIYWVATPPRWQGRGLATRLLAAALLEARARGCETSSLQASPMGEPVYARLGYARSFRLHMYERRD